MTPARHAELAAYAATLRSSGSPSAHGIADMLDELLADVPVWRPIAGLAPCSPSLSPPHYVLMFNGHHVGVGWRGEDDLEFGPQFWSETGEPIEPRPTHYRELPEPPHE